MKLLTKIVAIILTGVATATQAANPLIGVWTAKPSWCAFRSQIGDHDPAPIRITATEIVGLENTCRITGTKPLMKSAWTLFEQCDGGGEGKYKAQDLFMVDHHGVLYRFSDDGFMIRMTRCK
jgi:hypothetical protein